jgi:N-acylneuraminate cytidylyltransferase
MGNLAIIPARGGSKRIPGKNIKEFLGKPIIAYSIEAALGSDLFDEVMVSTDDDIIAATAFKYGAKIPFLRSEKNADDFATTIDVIHEVLTNYKKEQKREFQFACCIYPTAPLMKMKHLHEGFVKMTNQDYISVFPVVMFDYPVWRGLSIDANGKSKMVWPEFTNSRSQDLEKVYHDAGQWYWFNTEKINDTLFTFNSGTVILAEDEVQDIDTIADWKLAEMKKTIQMNTNI